jgi:hypothetical protein
MYSGFALLLHEYFLPVFCFYKSVFLSYKRVKFPVHKMIFLTKTDGVGGWMDGQVEAWYGLLGAIELLVNIFSYTILEFDKTNNPRCFSLKGVKHFN